MITLGFEDPFLEPKKHTILQEQLAPRVQMPWHPKYLKENLVICLRRNIGHGKVLEGF